MAILRIYEGILTVTQFKQTSLQVMTPLKIVHAVLPDAKKSNVLSNDDFCNKAIADTAKNSAEGSQRRTARL
jgi:hypothetical protein